MPLIILCGFPASGKTTIAKKLEEHFIQNTTMKVVLVNEESEFIKRNVAYQESRDEKNTRATIKAAVDRNVTKSVIVICDSLNYIKGFRYEQWCSARSAGTPCCVVWCKATSETAIQRNANNENDQNKWDEKLLNELIMRFEPPSATRRWENPTFEIEETDPIPFDQITNHLTVQLVQHKSLATQTSKISDTNYLHDLDKVTQDIVKEILKAQNEIQCNVIEVSMSTKKILCFKALQGQTTLSSYFSPIHLSHVVNMAELRRLRQQFIYLSKSLTQTKTDYCEKTTKQIADEFIDYLNENLQ